MVGKYRETITRTAEADYAHMQKVPPLQFARVKLRLRPLARGEGLKFANEAVDNAIPARWIASIERGILDAAKTGVLGGGPVVDCQVTVYGGAYHDMDSNDEAFFIAAQKAFWQAMRAANPELIKTSLRLITDDEGRGKK